MTAVGTMFNKGAAPILERAVSFAEQRHRLIALNIANVETPGYRPVDVPQADFHAALRRSLAARDKKPVPTFDVRSRRGVRADENSLSLDVVPAQEAGAMRHSENRVDIDLEMARLAENGLKYRMYSTLLKKQWTLLRDTISERP